MKNVLILDGSGKTGHVVTEILSSNNFNVFTIELKTINDMFTYNVKHIEDTLKERIYLNKIHVIINLARVINSDAENDKLAAININSILPILLEKITKGTTKKVIQISTDCVFSGENGPYTVEDFKDGKSTYALTKSIGEICNDKDVTIRTSIIGPDMNCEGNRLFNWFMSQANKLIGYTNVLWNGITSIELSKILIKIINEDVSGVLHIGTEGISKYELLKIFNKFFKNNQVDIIESKVPYTNKVLISNLESKLYSVASYEVMMLEMKKWIKDRKEKYPHYNMEENNEKN